MFGCNESRWLLLQGHCSVWSSSRLSSLSCKIRTKPYIHIEGKKTNIFQHRHIIIIILISTFSLLNWLSGFLHMSDF